MASAVEPLRKKAAPTKRKFRRGLQPKNDLKFWPFPEESNFSYVIGVDEVGVACLAGPVVAGCYAFPVIDHWTSLRPATLIHDSKTLDEEKRRAAEGWLRAQEKCLHAIAESTVEEIDEINIYHASHQALVRAFEQVWAALRLESHFQKQPRALLLIDGNRVPKSLSLPTGLEVRAVIKGDTKCFSVAAASILAKNYRDEFMRQIGQEFLEYGWASNVGYPTPVHRAALKKLGPTRWHRRSFNLEF